MKKLFTFLFLLTFFHGNSQITWQLQGVLPGIERLEAISFTLGNSAYFGTGYGSNSMALNDMWKFSPNTNSWVQLNNFPTTLYGATAFVINDTAYVANGWEMAGSSPNMNIYRYDEQLDSFVVVSIYPGTPSYTTMSFVANSKAYIGIGYPLNNDLWEFEPTTNSWTQKSDFPGAFRQNTSAFGINGKGYVGGGANDPIIAYDDFWVYDPINDSWDTLPSLPGGGRFAGIEFTINDKFYVGCGYNYSNYLKDLWSFNTFTNTWSQEIDFGGTPRYGCSAFTVGNTVYAGSGRASSYQNDFWQFAPMGPNLIKGHAYRDFNSNGTQDSNESPVKNLLIEVVPSGNIYSTDHSGDFQGIGYLGLQNMNILNPPSYYNYTPIQPINFISSGNIDTSTIIVFTPNSLNTDLEIHVTPLTPAQPGHQEVYNIDIKNNGTLDAQNFTITSILDSGLQYNNIIPSNTTVLFSNDSLTLFINSLTPGESKSFMIYTNVGIFYLLNDTIKVRALAQIQSTDVDTINNYSEESIAVVSSYDPNDISVSPSTSVTTSQIQNETWLTYTIRFQNTGNAFADEVRICDSISNSLNLSSLEILSASHNFTFNLNGDRILKFTFPNILLADSNSNEAASHGFIKYRIKPHTTLTNGDSIVNNAYIYFDYNPAVATNNVVTNISNLTSLITHSKSTYIYPNPAKDILFIKGVNPIQSVSIFNSLGQLESKTIGQNLNQVKTSNLKPGIYFAKVIDSYNQSNTFKIIISK